MCFSDTQSLILRLSSTMELSHHSKESEHEIGQIIHTLTDDKAKSKDIASTSEKLSTLLKTHDADICSLLAQYEAKYQKDYSGKSKDDRNSFRHHIQKDRWDFFHSNKNDRGDFFHLLDATEKEAIVNESPLRAYLLSHVLADVSKLFAALRRLTSKLLKAQAYACLYGGDGRDFKSDIKHVVFHHSLKPASVMQSFIDMLRSHSMDIFIVWQLNLEYALVAIRAQVLEVVCLDALIHRCLLKS